MYNIGVDIIEVDRIKNAILRNDLFKKKVFTEIEISYCERLKNKYESYAARFAAKEAYIKAISENVDFLDLEVINDEKGKPSLYYKKNKINGDLSLSHIKEYAIASVIIEKKD